MTDVSNNDNIINIKANVILKYSILTLSAIVTLFIVGWLLWYSRYGIDFTDEGFYLTWMFNPFNYSVSATQFGFVYHPLYKLLNGNIVALRQANILITFGLAWVLSNVFLKNVFGIQSFERTFRFVISGSIATAAAGSLVYAGLWMSTPSYNSLALQSLLVAAIGLLLADKYTTPESIIGWCLIGVGGWLAFMAKPTTAATLALCIGFYLLFAGKLSLRFLAISVVVALGLIVFSAFTIDGSVIAFIDRLKEGAEMYHVLGGGHEANRMLRLDNFQLGIKGNLILGVCTAVFCTAVYCSQASSKVLVYGGNAVSIVLGLGSLTIALGLTQQVFYVPQFQGLLIFSIPYAIFLAGLLIYRSNGLFQISFPKWILMITFLVFPYAYAFGTGNNYWVSSSMASIFWVFAGLVFMDPIVSYRNIAAMLLPLGLAVQLITIAQIQSGLETPYRQPQPLRENDVKFEIGQPGYTLVLSNEFAQYITEVKSIARQAEFKQGTPMIDLTGQSPGILYFLGASSIGQPWTVGGYPGSQALAIAMLKKVSCQELAEAWILVEAEGPRKISPMILLSYGANLITDFEVVGTFKTAKGAGGYNETRVQQLFKPIRPIGDAVADCSAERQSIRRF